MSRNSPLGKWQKEELRDNPKARQNKHGHINVYDKDNNIVATQKLTENQKAIKEKRALTKGLAFKNKVFDCLVKGYTVEKIAEEIGVNVKTLYRKFALDEAFKKDMVEMRKVRGLYFESQYLKVLDEVTEDSEVQVAKLKLQGYKQLAAWNAPETFGEKKVVEGNADKPVQVVFSTGIDRSITEEERDEKFVPSEVKDEDNE